MRVLVLATILAALATDASARSHPRRQCKPKHTSVEHSRPAAQSSAPASASTGHQLVTKPSPSGEASPVASSSAVTSSTAAETPAASPSSSSAAETSSSAAESPSATPSESPAASESSVASESPATSPSATETASSSPAAETSSSAAESPAATPSESVTPSESASAESVSETPSSSSAPEAPASTGSFSAPSSSEGAQTGPQFNQDEIVKLHNDLRATHGSPPLTWDQSLADYAANWANGCKFEHSQGPHGENLAAGTLPSDLAAQFKMWADEEAQYDYSNPGFSPGTGHFTQAVWKGTTSVGCAWKTCGGGSIFDAQYGDALYLVCEYSPPGNYVSGQAFRENVLPPQ